MDHYIDIVLKPDAEMRENEILNQVFTKFHKALFRLKSTEIGVSFPKLKVKLGDVLRIHGGDEHLTKLQELNWLDGIAGSCEVSDLLPVSENVLYRTVSRKQPTMTKAKLNRLIKRRSIKSEDVKQYKAKMFQQSLDNPYLELQSGSNGHFHRRFITFSELVEAPNFGEFDQFGLSNTATIPWF